MGKIHCTEGALRAVQQAIEVSVQHSRSLAGDRWIHAGEHTSRSSALRSQAASVEKLQMSDIRAYNASPEAKAHLRKIQQDLGRREGASVLCQTRNADPKFQEVAQANHWTPENRAAQAAR